MVRGPTQSCEPLMERRGVQWFQATLGVWEYHCTRLAWGLIPVSVASQLRKAPRPTAQVSSWLEHRVTGQRFRKNLTQPPTWMLNAVVLQERAKEVT